MAEDGCVNSGIFQNLDILGKVEFKDVEFTGNSTIGTSRSTDTLTIKSRIRIPPPDPSNPESDDINIEDLESGTKILCRQSDNTLRFEPKAESVFKTIIVDNQDNIVASNLTDTFTLKPGTNMTIQTDKNSKTITFASSNGTNTQDLYKTIRVDGHNDLIPNTSTDILKFVGTNNIDIVPTGGELDGFLATITFGNVNNNVDNENKKITLYNGTTAVDFVMVTTTPITPTDTLVQFQKETDNDTTITNLHNAINNHSPFTSKKANSGQSYSNELEITQRNNVSPLSNSTNFEDNLTVSNFSSIDVFHTSLKYNSVLHTNTLNIGKSLILKNRDGVDVDFLMKGTGDSLSSSNNNIQFNKGANEDATVTNLSNAINSYRDFHSTLDLVNQIISVTIFSHNHPNIDDGIDNTTDSNRDTFMDTGNDENVSLITPNFSLVNQEIAILTIGLKDNKIIDDLVIGEDSTDMLLVNSETTFTSNITFTNDIEITDNLKVDNLNINGNTISSTNTDGDINIIPIGSGRVDIDNVDIDGGNIDGTIIGATTAAAGTFTSLNVSDGTIINVGSISLDIIAADDGSSFSFGSDWTALGRTCDNLGTVTTAIINGGNIDGVAIGTNNVCTDLRVDNIQINGNTISSTNTDGDINIIPIGSGRVDIDNVDIDGGNIDGTIIGATTAAAGTFTSLNVSDGTIGNVNDISLDSISANNSSSFSFGSDWTALGRTCANLGIVTTADINGGNIDGTIIGANAAAAGTFTSLNIDNLSINGNTILSTSGNINITSDGGKIDAGTADIASTGIIGDPNATLLGTISASTPLQPNIISVGTLASLDISGDLSVDTDVLKVDSTNNRVGINKINPDEHLDVNGNVNISGNLKIGSAGGVKRITYLNNSNQINTVATPAKENTVLANNDQGQLSWVTYGTVSTGGIDTDFVRDVLSSPLDTDYYVGNDENNLFVSSGRSNFLENVDIIDSKLTLSNTNDDLIILENSKIEIFGSDASIVLKNTTDENTDGGAESKIQFTDHSDAILAQIQGSHDGTGNDTKGDLIFSTNDGSPALTEKMRIDSLGNVGIGTTNPVVPLHIKSTDTGDVDVLMIESIYGGSTDIGPAICFVRTDSILARIRGIEEGSFDGGLIFETVDVDTTVNPLGIGRNGATTERMRIDQVGNVGIGTDNPSEKLQVEGNMILDNQVGGAIIKGYDDHHAIYFRHGYDDEYNVLDFHEPGHIRFFTGDLIHQQTEKMRIQDNGNVGIGTTNPQSSLHVAGTRNNTPTVKGIHLGMNGADAGIEIVANSTTNNSFIDFTKPDSDFGGRIIYHHTNDSMVFHTNGATEKMKIDSAGNVGIGVTNPTNKLEVNGNVNLGSTTTNQNKFIGYGTIPIGGIIMWNNLNGENEPDGWALCTGQTVNGHTTPNLKGRFIMSSTYGPNDTGEGTTDYQVTPLGNTGGEQFVTLSEAEIPSHTHTGSTNDDGAHYHDSFQLGGEYQGSVDYTKSGGSNGLRFNMSDRAIAPDGGELKVDQNASEHVHQFTTNPNTPSGAIHENRPPFYVLAYIMRVY